MRSFTILLIFVFSFNCNVFCQNFNSWNFQAECVDVVINNAARIKLTIFDNRSKLDIDMVKKYAVHTILIKGLVGGNNCINQPPILKQTDIDANLSFLKQLLGKKGNYNKYIISVEELENNILDKNKIKQKSEHSAIVTLNKELLRNDLITNKIIKPLTAGF